MMLDPIGECDRCGEVAFFEGDEMYCMQHSSLINGVEPDEVSQILQALQKIDGVEKVDFQPMGFIGAVTSRSEIPWEVHEFADENDYRVFEREQMQGGQFVLEPKDPKIPYTEVDDLV